LGNLQFQDSKHQNSHLKKPKVLFIRKKELNLTSSDNSTNPRVGHQIIKKQGLDNDSFSTIMKRTTITKV
jgi:hypothetical protein